jgi:hypothetical protein
MTFPLFQFIAETPGAARAASMGLVGLATTAVGLVPAASELAPYGLAGVGGITGFIAWQLIQEKKDRKDEQLRRERIDAQRIDADKAAALAAIEAAKADVIRSESTRALTASIERLIHRMDSRERGE